jgi:predicted nucleic acid-binding protein
MGRLSVSAITRLEVHAGMQPDERYATNKLLSRFITYDMNRELADRAGDLVRESQDRHVSLDVPDAIIAATALTHGLAWSLNRPTSKTSRHQPGFLCPRNLLPDLFPLSAAVSSSF